MPDVHLGRPHTGAVWPGGKSLQGPHRVGAFCVCPQLEAFAHELELRSSVEKPAPRIGTLVHVGLAYRYGTMLPQKPEWLVYPDGRNAIWACGEDTPEERDEALRVFDAYQTYYNYNTITPILVEHQFVVDFDLGDGVKEPYSCRSDLVGWEDGQLNIYDHKVFSRISRQTGWEHRADRQMLTNIALARACGYDVKNIVLNTMTKDKPMPRFARYVVPISEKAYAELGADTLYWLRRMNETRKLYPDPLNRPKTLENCVRKYGACVVAGTQVRTRRGWLPVERVVVGDAVVGIDGAYHTVENIRSRAYEGDVVKIQAWRHGMGVTVTPEHRVLADGHWCEARELVTGQELTLPKVPFAGTDTIDLLPFVEDIVRPRRPYPEKQDQEIVAGIKAAHGRASSRKVAALFGVDPGVVWRIWRNMGKAESVHPVLTGDRITLYGAQFKPLPAQLKITPAFAELAGLFIAEGHTAGKITFSFGSHEEHTLAARCRDLAQEALGEPATIRTAGSVTRVTISHTLWAWIFRKWFGEYAHEKRMPVWLEAASFRIFSRVLRGWIAGDGGSFGGVRAYGVTASPGLALQFLAGLARAGLNASVVRMTDRDGGVLNGRRIVQRHPTYALNLSGACFRALASVLDLAVPTGRTSEAHPVRHTEHAFHPRIRRITRFPYKGLVYDLGVPDGSAFNANGIIVHNCDFRDPCHEGQHTLVQFKRRTDG